MNIALMFGDGMWSTNGNVDAQPEIEFHIFKPFTVPLPRKDEAVILNMVNKLVGNLTVALP